MDKIEKNIEGKKRWIVPKLLKLDQKDTEGGVGSFPETAYGSLPS